VGTCSMSIALLFLAVEILPCARALSSTAAEIPVFDRLSVPWGAAATASTTGVSTLMDLRGGGLFGGKKKSAAKIYRESLEEQVMLLNEQLRHARIEVTTLRENARRRHQGRNTLYRAAKESAKTSKEEEKLNKEKAKKEQQLEKQREKEQKEALSRLEGEIKQLEQMKGKLEKLLETSAIRIEALEAKLASQDSLSAEKEASYKEQIAKLKSTLADLQTAQLEKLTEIHQQKIDAAVRDALNAQAAEFRAKMEETTERLTREHAKEMEQEKLRSSKVVETERKKMRKLVRALALREKRLKLQNLDSSSTTKSSKDETSTPATTSVKTGSSFKNITPPTNRGTI